MTDIEVMPEWQRVKALPFAEQATKTMAALQQGLPIVVEAPPGAGKTTVLPLLADYARGKQGKTLVLEPRRAATRAAALRLAQIRGEEIGQSVGYRMRDDTRVSKATQIEFVTEAVLTRMIQSDPSLDGYATIIFDEFHERHLASDFGLALALDVHTALRPDLALIVMSATLDAGPVATLIETATSTDVKRIKSDGRAYPVVLHYRARPWRDAFRHISDAVAAEVVDIWQKEGEGSILVFLPGIGEIKRCQDTLSRALSAARTEALYGAQNMAEQRKVIEYDGGARRIVLATPLAESALTLRDVRIVVDSGLVRRPQIDPASGMSRLVVERVSKAEAEQRAGRAGRVAAGAVYRLWTEGEHGGLLPFPPAEIERSPMNRLALDLAEWGDASGTSLAFLTPPSPNALSAAQNFLKSIGAVGNGFALTEKGRQLHALPLEPRLGAIFSVAQNFKTIALAGETLEIAKIIPRLMAYLEAAQPRDLAEFDLEVLMLEMLQGKHAALQPDRKAISRFAKTFQSQSNAQGTITLSALLAYGYPDRIARRRTREDKDFLLSSGQGVRAPIELPLKDQFLIATNIHGERRDAEIKQMVTIEADMIADIYRDQFEDISGCQFNAVQNRIYCKQAQRFGAITVHEAPLAVKNAQGLIEAQKALLTEAGLHIMAWSKSAKRYLNRARFTFTDGRFADEAIIAGGDMWLPSLAPEATRPQDFAKVNASDVLEYIIDWQSKTEIDRLCPEKWVAPDGRAYHLEMSEDGPEVAVRLTSLYGLKAHPQLGQARQPLRMTLLSPADRPLQITTDIAGFWRTSYPEIRKEMRGRYPKHHWPEDPENDSPRFHRRS